MFRMGLSPSEGTCKQMAMLQGHIQGFTGNQHTTVLSPVTRVEIHAFSDASQRAIGAAIYLRLFNSKEDIAVFLLFGQAKVAPIMPTSIPRLELCGAVLAAQAIDRTTSEMRAEGSTSM